MTKGWYNYLWIFSLLYLILGFFNIIFAWLGLLCFFIPLIIAIFGKGKSYCNKYCGRGQLFSILGKKLSRKKDIHTFIRTKWFRYGFLTFFLVMFIIMLFKTYLVLVGANSLKKVVTLFWTFKLPWEFAYNTSSISPWIIQFAYGFYSIMLTSTILGLITMVIYKPRSWCVYCPMGTMTQLICKIKHRKDAGLKE